MRVTYIHQHFATPSDAFGTRSYELSRRLIDHGHEVTMICGATAGASTEEGRVDESIIDGIKVVRVAQDYSNTMGFVARTASFARFAATACRLAGSIPTDLVFATSTPLTVAVPGAWGALRQRVPFVFEIRDLWPDLPVAMGVIDQPAIIFALRRLERFGYRRADHIIALSPGMQAGIERAGVPRNQISLIPNASDVELFSPSDDPLTDPAFGIPDEFRICYPGVHGNANGLDAVLDALGELKRRGEQGIRLVCIGDGALKPGLVERAATEGLADYVSFIDPMPKRRLAEVLPRFDAGLMTLRNVDEFHFGTSPNKFFDYLACGLPVVNNYPGWVAELINEHGCGVVSPPDDPAALADTLIALRDDSTGRKQMGVNARALAQAQFDRDTLGNQFVETLERVHDANR